VFSLENDRKWDKGESDDEKNGHSSDGDCVCTDDDTFGKKCDRGADLGE
jgi:hypothetical protein